MDDLYEIGSAKRVHKKDWKTEGIPFYRAREIVKLARKGFVENDLFISDGMYEEYKSQKGAPKAGDLMVTGVGTVGICYLVTENDKFYFKDASVLWFQPKTEVEPKFIEYLFQTPDIIEQTNSGEGATVKTLTISRAKKLTFPLPPLEEQRRIVALLDQAFEGLDRARANTETNLESCDKFTVSVLERFVGDKLPGWSSGSLNEVASILAGGDVDKKRLSKTKTKEHRVPIYTNGEKNLGLYGFTNEARVFEPTVTVSARGTIGFAVIRNEPFYPAVRLICVTPAENLNIKYLYYYIRSKTVDQSGTSIPQLTVPMMRKFEIFYPDLMEQERISSELEEVENRIGDIRNKVVEKLATIENLRQSLLAKAFAGELT